jgi:hypothetical protein
MQQKGPLFCEPLIVPFGVLEYVLEYYLARYYGHSTRYSSSYIPVQYTVHGYSEYSSTNRTAVELLASTYLAS